MTRSGPRVVPSVLLALVLALGALVTPVLRAPVTNEVGRVASAVHAHVVGAVGQQGERVRATLAGTHVDGAAPGGTGGSGGPDPTSEPVPATGFAVALAAMGFAVALALRREGRQVGTVRGRSPPVGRAALRPDHRTGARSCTEPARCCSVLRSSSS
jgi:hypothetical protein